MTDTAIEELRRQLREQQGQAPLRRLMRIAEAIIEREPGDAMALGFLGKACVARGDVQRAAGYAREITKRWPDNASAWTNLAHIERTRGDLDAALAALHRALQLEPDAPLVILRAAETLAAAGHRELATRAAGTAFCLEPALRDAYRNPEAQDAARQLSRIANELLRDRQWTLLGDEMRSFEAAGADELPRLWEFIRGFLGMTPVSYQHPLQRPSDLYVPGLTAKPWWEREEVPCVQRVEAAYDAIHAEMSAVVLEERELLPYIDDDPDVEQAYARIAGTLDWSAYHFFRRGQWIEEHVRRCPDTMAVMRELPLITQRGHGAECFFSVVRPHTRIPPHVGHSNVKLGVHFPLIVPPDCGFRVGGETRVWEVGRCLIFDDGFVHEVWNDSDQPRVVLIFDLWHPELGAEERQALHALTECIDGFRQAMSRETVDDLLAGWPAAS